MELILIIQNGNYENPFSFHRGSSVDCTFSDALRTHPLFFQQPRRGFRPQKRKRAKSQTIIRK